jgi:hypothetical protein
VNTIATIARHLPTGRAVRGGAFIGSAQMPQTFKPSMIQAVKGKRGHLCHLPTASLWTTYEDCRTPGGSA